MKIRCWLSERAADPASSDIHIKFKVDFGGTFLKIVCFQKDDIHDVKSACGSDLVM